MCINPGCWRSLQRLIRLRPLLGRAGHHRVPGSPFDFERIDPPLVRFISLQRLPATLCCPGLPSPDNPAPAFASRGHPEAFACSSFAHAVFSPRNVIARAPSLPTLPPRAGHSPDISSFRRYGPADGAVCGLARFSHLAALMGFWSLRSFSPVARV